MANNLRKVLANRNKAKENEAAGVSVYPTEEILGSVTEVREFALFYAKQKVNLEIIHSSGLLDYCKGDAFTPGEKKAFEMGLDFFIGFFENAELDINTYMLKAQSANAKAGEAKTD